MAIFNPSKGIPQFSANRLRRWSVILANYNYTIEFVKSENNKADCLSRLPVEDGNKSDGKNDIICYLNGIADHQIQFEEVEEATRRDIFL